MLEKQKKLLKNLPGVDHILDSALAASHNADIPKNLLLKSIQRRIETLRSEIIKGESGIDEDDTGPSKILKESIMAARAEMVPKLVRVVNGTGVVVHTNLGRSLLSDKVLEHIREISSNYSNLEFDLSKGMRGSRHLCVEDIICELSGAESAMVVNNNAAAVLLCLETVAGGRKVVVSRGELVEIGGSFRIPEVMAKSGGILKEVGTTNRTHAKDYEEAADDDVALFLKVHASNYSVVGFTAEVSLSKLVSLGAALGIPVMEDLGSGSFMDFSEYGLAKGPTVQESVAAGADIVTFSGDKLLGGPQAGIIAGKKDIVEAIKKNPLARALRVDKLTLAALEPTLRLYRDPEKAARAIPTLDMLTMSMERIEEKASRMAKIIKNRGCTGLEIIFSDSFSKAGGGSLPLLKLPTKCMGIKIAGVSANGIEKFMRSFAPPIIGRIENDLFLLDLRTIRDDEPAIIKRALSELTDRQ